MMSVDEGHQASIDERVTRLREVRPSRLRMRTTRPRARVRRRLPLPPFTNSGVTVRGVEQRRLPDDKEQHLRWRARVQDRASARAVRSKREEAVRIFKGAPMTRAPNTSGQQEERRLEGAGVLPQAESRASQLRRRAGYSAGPFAASEKRGPEGCADQGARRRGAFGIDETRCRQAQSA